MDTENIERVAGHFDATPNCSIRQAAQVLGYKKSSVHNIVKHELKLYPYKTSVHHALKETDKTLRVNFAETILDRIALDEDYLSRICFSELGNVSCFWNRPSSQRTDMGERTP